MKTPLIILAGACLILLTFTGCSTTGPANPAVTKAVVKTAVTAGVIVGVRQQPVAVDYLRAAAPIVCQAARGTNLSPAWITQALESNASVTQWKTPEAALIFNSALGIYSTLYEAYGANYVANLPQLQAWLGGLCEGILAGLPPAAARATPMDRAPRPQPAVKLPPHVGWPVANYAP